MVIKEFWDNRYSQEDYAYGIDPNEYFKTKLDDCTVGKILLPAEGEGRNAVYAAKNGWEVFAFDWSLEAKKKALLLAEQNGVNIRYDVGDIDSLIYEENQFDVIGLTYAHFTTDSISSYHKKLIKYLRKGGMVIFEAFSKNHVNYNQSDPRAGGPKDPNMLFALNDIATDFKDFDVIDLIETEVDLKEGLFHNGKGSVIRFAGIKR